MSRRKQKPEIIVDEQGRVFYQYQIKSNSPVYSTRCHCCDYFSGHHQVYDKAHFITIMKEKNWKFYEEKVYCPNCERFVSSVISLKVGDFVCFKPPEENKSIFKVIYGPYTDETKLYYFYNLEDIYSKENIFKVNFIKLNKIKKPKSRNSFLEV